MPFPCFLLFASIFGGFPVVEHVPGHPQTVLSVAAAPDGRLIAGGAALQIWDGARWAEVETPDGAYGFKALAAATDRKVYAGGADALGFVDFSSGNPHYVSLAEQADRAGLSRPFEAWTAAISPDGPVWVTAQQVIRWTGRRRFEVWTLPCTPRLFAFRATPGPNSSLWIFQGGVGLLHLEAGGPRLVYPRSQLPNEFIVWGAERSNGSLVFGTDLGVYQILGGRCERLEELSVAVEGAQPTCALELTEERIAIGTYQKGVLFGNFAGTEPAGGGMPDAKVNALAPAGNGWVWAATDGGLARIEASGASARLGERTGTVRAKILKVAARSTNEAGLPSNLLIPALAERTVYEIGASGVGELPAPRTIFWDETRLGPDLLVSGFGGIWKTELRSAPAAVKSATWTQIFYSASDVFQIAASRFHPNTILFTEGTAVRALRPSKNGWAVETLVAELGDLPCSLLEDAGGDVWVATNRMGIYRYGWYSESGPLLLKAHYERGAGLPENSGKIRGSGPKLALVGTRVAAFTPDIVELEESGTRSRFVPAKEFTAFVGLAASDTLAATTNSSEYWVVKNRTLSVLAIVRVFDHPSSTLSWQPLEFPGLDQAGSVASVNANGPDLWVGGENGVLACRPSTPAEGGVSVTPPQSCRLWRLDRPPEESKAAAFNFVSPRALSSQIFYQTCLSGADSDWSAPAQAAKRAYSGLAPGAYVFEVRAVDRWGRAGPSASLPFTIPAPWWRTGTALAAEGALLVLAAVGAARWRAQARLAALRRRADELDRLVQSKTRELEMANAAKSEFLETISHEIRNPLNGVTGLTRLLSEAPLRPEERQLAASLGACAQALSRIFDEVLNFARIEHGEVGLKEREFDLEELTEELLFLFKLPASERACEFSVRIYPPFSASSGSRFVGDDGKIRTVVGNFLSNAIKYAPGSPVQLAVELGESSPFASDLTFSVTDGGPGIPPEEQELIFKKFARGSAAGRRKEPGTGLGLATCVAFAERMGGGVAVESEPGHGSTFLFRVRLQRARAQSLAADPETLSGSDPAAGWRALIVDDQEYNRLVTRRLAEQMGYETRVAADVDGAAREFAAFQPDLVLVDWELPGVKGVELVRRIRAIMSASSVPVIVATTAHDRADLRGRQIEEEMDGVILKPFDLEQLARAIDAARAVKGRGPRHGVGGLDLRVFGLTGTGDAAQTDAAVRQFLELLGRDLEILKVSLGAGDSEASAQAAHRLKNHAGLVNARELRAAAERMYRNLANPEAWDGLRLDLERQAAIVAATLASITSLRLVPPSSPIG